MNLSYVFHFVLPKDMYACWKQYLRTIFQYTAFFQIKTDQTAAKRG